MSFDIFLQKFKNGAPAEVSRSGILALLKSQHYTGPDSLGFYDIRFADGVSVEFSAQGLESSEVFEGCAFHVRGFSEQLVEFVFDVARAGSMAIIPVTEDPVVLLTSENDQRELPSDVLRDFHIILLMSAAELQLILQQGYTVWSKYREQAAGGAISNTGTT